ncbi:MAG: ABC transporter permease [Myxococcota bacterium]
MSPPGAEAVRQAVRLLRAHRVRALLTLFGLAWGTAAVIFLVSWGEGVVVMLERGFFRAGKNMGEVWTGVVSEEFTPAMDRRYLWYTMEDVAAVRKRARLPLIVGGEAWEMLPAAFGQRALNVDVRGIEPEVMEIRGVSVVAGRGITRSDVSHRRRVVVLGDKVRRRLLGPRGAVGSWIRLAGRPFRVVGLLEEVGTQLSRDRLEIDEHVWIPISTLQATWPRWWTDELVVTKILYTLSDRRLLFETEAEVRSILADRLGVPPQDEEAIPIWSSLKMLNKLPLEETRGLLFVLAAATLLIGGIGVLNMMLDSVYERRTEIGTRLAIGARRRDIVAQFFVETFAVTALGGLAGAALGVGGCLFLGSLEVPDLIPIPRLRAEIVVLALSILGGVGLVAGVVPAWRASRVDPAASLRME